MNKVIFKIINEIVNVVKIKLRRYVDVGEGDVDEGDDDDSIGEWSGEVDCSGGGGGLTGC